MDTKLFFFIFALRNFEYNKFFLQPSHRRYSNDATVISNATAEEELKCCDWKKGMEVCNWGYLKIWLIIHLGIFKILKN